MIHATPRTAFSPVLPQPHSLDVARRPTVLVSSGDPLTRRLLRAALEWSGCTVSDVRRDVAALVVTRQPSPDLVVLELDGEDTEELQLLRLTRFSGFAGPRVLAVTDGDRAARDAAWAAGADDVLERPIHPAVLRKRIAILLADGAGLVPV